MLDLIIQLLFAIGISVSGPDAHSVVVIDNDTGATYGLGSTVTVGNRPAENTEVYMLMHDKNGNYYLVKK